MQNYADEIEWLKQKVTENSASMLYARLADRYLQMKEIDRAIEMAERGVLLHPHYATARYVLAKCLFGNSQFDEANKHLKEALAIDPEHLKALELQSELLQRLGDKEGVEENVKRMLAIDPLDNTVPQKFASTKPVEPTGETVVVNDIYLEDFLESGVTKDLEPEPEPNESVEDIMTSSAADTSDDIFEDEETALTEPVEEDFADFLQESPQKDAKTDNPFDDFESVETTEAPHEPQTEETPVTPVDHKPKLETPQPIIDEPTVDQVEEEREKEKIREEVLDESIDDDFEVDRSKYKEEEYRFTELLDNIFSSSLDEEEQAENEIRDTIERMANENAPQPKPEEKSPEAAPPAEPLMPPPDNSSPEEQILESAKEEDEDDFLHLGPDLGLSSGEEETLPDEFLPQDDEKEESPLKDELSSFDIDDTPSIEPEPQADFSEFISSLDIKEDVGPLEGEDKAPVDEDLPDFDLEMEPFSEASEQTAPEAEKADDDWASLLGGTGQDETPMTAEPEPPSEETFSSRLEDTAPTPEAEFEPENEEPEPQKEQKESTAGRSRGKFYTPTLGEIYAAQGQYSKAISVYETLLKQEPENESYRKKLEALRKKLEDQQRGL